MSADAEGRVVALSRELERTSRRLGELDALVRELAGTLAELAAAPAGAQPQQPASPVRPWLGTPDVDTAVADLEDLADWLAAVYLRYADALLPSCWAWHADIVEELHWLRGAYHDAYGLNPPGAGAAARQTPSWQKVGDWHDRLRPGVVRRIKTTAGSCELSRHAPGQYLPQRQNAAPLASQLRAIAASWASTGAPPTVTDDLLAQARHEQQLHLRNHQP
ncbi:hypothetical protein [Pseudonocardia sp. WMMC193]|uniref:hypothetical protein n=1 Tax=Pseudonocardia sp. WMMC193 TaxID=2911965 RepID=UPI001F263D1F|nr:hypothetical protein [Pseudonocardia sp. WMMC193]MCF7552245.1 hypothetical protein [Pseudonocardia sp. WMMC193]